MIKYLKQIDKLLRDTFDYLGVPTLEDLDKHVSKTLKEIKNFKIQDIRYIEIPVLLGYALVVLTLGSVTTLFAIGVPDVAKDGLRLTALISSLCLAGLALHLTLKKVSGAK